MRHPRRATLRERSFLPDQFFFATVRLLDRTVTRLARLSDHVRTLLGGRRKGGASAPPKSRLPSSVGPVPRAVPQARDCAGHGRQQQSESPCNGGAEAPPFQTGGQKRGPSGTSGESMLSP
jgi:hypothetical protein